MTERFLDKSTDEIKVIFDRRLKKFSEMEILGLGPHQIYPPKRLFNEEYIQFEYTPLIDKDTPVGSMGSCFAREIKNYLQGNGFNYVHYGEGKHSAHGSAPWDRVYNTGCMLQEVQRAFDMFDPDVIPLPGGAFMDPHRKGAVYESEEEAKGELELYKTLARGALLESRVFIFTLGLSEVWYDKISNKYFSEPPMAAIFDRRKHGFKLLSPDENIWNVQSAINVLKNHNPDIDIIITVSPIPLRASFSDRSILVSNNVSKASLLYTAHRICHELKLAHYFPSYEITMQMLNDPFDWDFRHVKDDAVENIMKYFEKSFCRH